MKYPTPPPDDNPERRPPRGYRDDPLGLAIELRNAVAFIVGRSQLLARRVRATDDVPPGAVLATLGDIERSAKAIVKLIADLEADEAAADAGAGADRRLTPGGEADGRAVDEDRVGG